MPVTDVAHHRHEAFMRRDHTACAQHRFHDEGGNGVGTLKGNLVGKGGSTELGQPRRIAFIKRVAIGIGGRDMIAAGQQRFLLRPEIGIAVHAGPANMRAVIALFQTDEFDASGIAANLVILPGKAQSCFHTVPAA